MPREWRDVEGRGAIALAGLVVVVALGCGLAFSVIGWLSKADERVASAYLERALLVEHAQSTHEEESASARAYLLTGSELALAASRRDRASFEADYAQLRASAAGSEDQDLLETIQRRDAAYEQSVERVLALRRAGAPEAEIRTDFEASVVPAKTELDTSLVAASARAQRQVVQAHQAAADARVRVTAVVIVAAFLVFVLATALAIFLRRTARRLLEERMRLAESLARVEQSNRDLDAFAGRVAHDLRNALSPVVMVSTLVRSSSRSPEKIALLCDRLDRANGRALVLLDALLAFARAQQETDGSPSASVAQVVAEVLEQIEPSAAQADAEIHSSVVDAQVRCPPGLLQVVVANVLGNAVKFLRGQAERRIRLSTELVRGGCLLRIEDTGPGIPEAARERIFEPFYRVPGTKQPGTGIGLATVRRILEAHGGRITVEGAVGSGCSFLVWLPLAAADHRLSAPPPALAEAVRRERGPLLVR
jgi:signal transduction histidine kinase